MSDNDRNEGRVADWSATDTCPEGGWAVVAFFKEHHGSGWQFQMRLDAILHLRNIVDEHREGAKLREALAALEQVQAEAAHLRRALEWLGDQWGGERHSGQKSDGHGPNCPLQPTVDLRDRTSCPYAPEAWHQPCQVIEGNITWRECCLRSALAATEEATDAET